VRKTTKLEVKTVYENHSQGTERTIQCQ